MEPAATFVDAGTVTPIPEAVRLTVNPLVGAARVNVTVHVDAWPAVMLVGAQLRPETCTGLVIFSATDFLTVPTAA